jgi:hypothetical protein
VQIQHPDSVLRIGQTIFGLPKVLAAAAGYSSVEEFVAHCVEKELKQHEADEVAPEQTRDVRVALDMSPYRSLPIPGTDIVLHWAR